MWNPNAARVSRSQPQVLPSSIPTHLPLASSGSLTRNDDNTNKE
uniref:Uncharacterized protein n=1 Tax=Microcebus murinus TaxID=30608 RepID=A0A8C5Y3H6_MICMU